jgi:hypothetical protein
MKKIEHEFTVDFWKPGEFDCCEEGIDKVFLQNAWFKEIMGKDAEDWKYVPSKRPIIKIQRFNDGVKWTIYRNLIAKTQEGFTKKNMQLHRPSVYMLGMGPGSKELFTISRSWWLPFFFNHPENTVRVPFKVAVYLGSLSIVLGIIGVLIGLVV